MLGSIVVVAAIIFAVILPAIVLFKHYSPKKYNIFENIMWIVLGLITWPFIPLVIAVRKKEKVLLTLFYISFLVMAVGAWYWSVLNVQKIIAIQQLLRA